MKKKIILLLILLPVLLSPVFGLKVPKLDGHVVDKAGVISASDEIVIEQMLTDLERSTTAQVAILTVPDLENESLEGYSLSVAEEWKLGQAEKDNGALILLSLREKKVRIEVGYGLEGDLTDAKSGYIIREIMLPQFREGNYAQGLYDGASAVGGVVMKTADISAEDIAAANQSASRKSSSGRSIPFNLVVFLIIIVFSSIGRLGRRGRRRGGILPWFFLGSMMGNNRHDRYTGGSSGFGGGGFGGFSGGGGGFGGGGASGGW